MTEFIEETSCDCGGQYCKLFLGDPRHGTPTGYGNNRCRCTPCTSAWAVYSVTARHARRQRGLPEGDRRHGTDNGYSNYGCRSETCARDGTYGCVQARAELRAMEQQAA